MEDERPMSEEEWRAWFAEADARTDRYSLLMDLYREARPRPPEDAPEETHEAWDRDLHDYLAAHMGWKENPDDDDGGWLDLDPEELAAFEADEEWEDPTETDPLCLLTDALARPLVEWQKGLPDEAFDDPHVLALWENGLLASAKAAGATAHRRFDDALGALIVQLGRVLDPATVAVEALNRLDGSPLMPEATRHDLLAAAHAVCEHAAGEIEASRVRLRELRGE